MENETLHIAIVPPVTVEANLIKQVAAAIDKDPRTAGLLLAGKIPRIIAHYQDCQVAESAAQFLRSLGLTVIVCKDSDLRQMVPSGFKAFSLKFAPQQLVFQDRGGKARMMETQNVFLILKGIRQTQTENEITKTKTKLNLTATILTGGLPILSKVKEKTSETSTQVEYFVKLYHRASSDPEVEIVQHSFDYSCLGTNMSTTTLVNLNNLCTRIKQLCPLSVLDERLVESSRLGVSSSMFPNNNDIQSKLIYLFHEAMSRSD